MSTEKCMSTEKWFWCMDYCIRHRLPPANNHFWREAINEYERLNP